ncbi:hypothetical protein V2J09_012757 [Rumex salicifolius]
MELDEQEQNDDEADNGSTDTAMEDANPKTSRKNLCGRDNGGDTDMGAGSREFLHTLKEIIRVNDPAILVLVETRLSGVQADKFCDSIGFDGKTRAEAIGFRGGIWVFWRKSIVELKQIDIHQQVVSLEVERSNEDRWLFSAIYASPNPANREELWNRLLNLKSFVDCPWLLMGDFNETASLDERTGNSDGMRKRCDNFQSWIDGMKLIELGFSGPKFTWSRGRDPHTRTSARLDRGLCNIEWREAYLEASIRHLPMNQSDHAPLLLRSNGVSMRDPNNRPFRFQAAWMLHCEFQEFVAEHWQYGADLPSALENLVVHLNTWNKDVFGNLFRRRNRLWRRIEGAQAKLCFHASVGLMRLEQELRSELDVVLDQIHTFWVQKARSDTLRDGDRNTKFFHSCAVVRRRRNKIDSLADANGNWVDDPRELKEMDSPYYF